MKSILTILSIVALTAVSAADLSAQATKVAYVELNGIVSRMPEFASAQQRLNNYRERMTRELSAEENRLRNEAQQLQVKRDSGVLSPQALATEEEKIRTETRALMERSQAADQEFARIEQEEMGKIMQRVNTAIRDVAREENIAYVLNDMTTEGDVFIIYVSDEVRQNGNITTKVMAKLGM